MNLTASAPLKDVLHFIFKTKKGYGIYIRDKTSIQPRQQQQQTQHKKQSN